jgi:hypothetical protein
MPQTNQATCTACNGTGEYHGTRRNGEAYVGRCFRCQGYRPPWNRARRAVPTDTAAMHWADFAAAHPGEAAWIDANPNNDFALSLRGGVERFGGLTERQMAAVQRNIERNGLRMLEGAPDVGRVGSVSNFVAVATEDGAALPPPALLGDRTIPEPTHDSAGNPFPRVYPHQATTLANLQPGYGAAFQTVGAPAAAEIMLDITLIKAALDLAVASGLRRVRLTIGSLCLTLADPNGRNPGCVYVRLINPNLRQTFRGANGIYMGRITTEGDFMPSTHYLALPKAEQDSLIDRLCQIAEDPAGAAQQHGFQTGNCACCGRLLTDPPSVARGIGPVCARRFGFTSLRDALSAVRPVGEG